MKAARAPSRPIPSPPALAAELRRLASVKHRAADTAAAIGGAILGTEPRSRDKRREYMLAYQDLVLEERHLLDMAREVE